MWLQWCSLCKKRIKKIATLSTTEWKNCICERIMLFMLCFLHSSLEMHFSLSLSLSLRHTGKREERKWNGENENRRIKWWISWLVGEYALHSAHSYACMNNFVGVGLKLIHNGALVACLNAFAGAEDPFTHTCQKHFNVDTKSAFIRMHHSHIF